MSITPILKSKEIIRILLIAGFKIIRQSGSHVRLQHLLDHARQVTVPMHGADIPKWLITNILRQAKISKKEFLKLFRK